MKPSRKLAVTLAVFAAGSVFFGSLPAQAKGIESYGAKIAASRHHGHRMPPPEFRRHHGDVPPPPEHRGHIPPPEFRRHRWDVPPPPEHRGHMPPPPPHHRHHW